jgi:cardiolipin synthase
MLFARIDLRNHRKIAVIDGLAAYCGSQNLTDESFCATRNRRVGLWLDTTIRVTGHAVHPLQAIFLHDWVADSEEALPDLGRFFPPPKPGADTAASGSGMPHFVPSEPAQST